MPTSEFVHSNKITFKPSPPIMLPTMTIDEIRLKKVYDLDNISRIDFD
jgi:hypothetical protein